MSSQAIRPYQRHQPHSIYYAAEIIEDYVEAACAAVIRLNEESLQTHDKANTGAHGDYLIILPTDEDLKVAHRVLGRYAKHWEGIIEGSNRYSRLRIILYTAESKTKITRKRGYGEFRDIKLTTPEHLEKSRGVIHIFVEGVTAVIDAALCTENICYPILPIHMAYTCLVPSTKTQVIERLQSVISSAPRHVAYYFLVTERGLQGTLRTLHPPSGLNCATSVIEWILNEFLPTDHCPTLIIPYPIIERGLEFLYSASLIDTSCKPIEPTMSRYREWLQVLNDAALARLMLTATEQRFACVLECAVICSMLKECPQPFLDMESIRNRNDVATRRLCQMSYAVQEGDLLSLINVMEAYIKNNDDRYWTAGRMLKRHRLARAQDLTIHLLETYRRIHGNPTGQIPSATGESNKILKAITVAFSENLITRRIEFQKPTYQLWRDRRCQSLFENERDIVTSSQDLLLRVHEDSNYHFGTHKDWPALAIFVSMTGTPQQQEIKYLSPVQTKWLSELMPHVYQET